MFLPGHEIKSDIIVVPMSDAVLDWHFDFN